MDLFHLTIAVKGRLTFAREEGEIRAAVRRFVRVAGPFLAVFCLVDDHLHALLRALHARTVAQRIRQALLRARPGIELDEPHLKPIADIDHLERVVGYILRQPVHHGLPGHPAAWSGSSFADFVRARALPGYSPAILVEELPRLRGREVYAMVGLDPVELEPVDDPTLRSFGPASLVDLAAAVLGVGPSLKGRSAPISAARALAAGIARDIGLPLSDLARSLEITRQAAQQLSQRQLEPRLVLAVRTRAALLVRSQTATYPTWLIPKERKKH